MKITHQISGIDKSAGGPSRSSTVLVKEISDSPSISKLYFNTGQTEQPIINRFESDKVGLNFYKSKKELQQLLKLQEIDLAHIHGIWNLPLHQTAKYIRSIHKPYVIAPRGMLEPWSLAQKSLKKKLALALYQRKDLEKASCIHATAQMEADNIRKLGFKNPIAVIPNGIDLKEYPRKVFKDANEKKRTILFLSRIHVKKGIELLIDAWTQLDEKLKADWQIKIAGNGEQAYINSLHQLIASKGLASSIEIIGAKFGEEKIQAYHEADLFVLPTYSENFGIVIGEALSCGIPVITTNGTPWQELNTTQSGWCIDIGVKTLVKTLEVALTKSNQELYEMGLKGRKLIEEEYAISSVAQKMIQLYQWLLGEIEKPEFIQTL